MKSSKKIELLQKDIMNAMKAINEINIERISENKTPSSGMVVFSFGSVEQIGSFGDMKDFKNIILQKAKECERFRNMLDSVQTNLMIDDLENRCLKVFEMDKPSPKKIKNAFFGASEGFRKAVGFFKKEN